MVRYIDRQQSKYAKRIVVKKEENKLSELFAKQLKLGSNELTHKSSEIFIDYYLTYRKLQLPVKKFLILLQKVGDSLTL